MKVMMISVVIGTLEKISKSFIKGAWGVGNRKTNGDHPDYSIVEVGMNTERSPGD